MVRRVHTIGNAIRIFAPTAFAAPHRAMNCACLAMSQDRSEHAETSPSAKAILAAQLAATRLAKVLAFAKARRLGLVAHPGANAPAECAITKYARTSCLPGRSPG